MKWATNKYRDAITEAQNEDNVDQVCNGSKNMGIAYMQQVNFFKEANGWSIDMTQEDDIDTQIDLLKKMIDCFNTCVTKGIKAKDSDWLEKVFKKCTEVFESNFFKDNYAKKDKQLRAKMIDAYQMLF